MFAKSNFRPSDTGIAAVYIKLNKIFNIGCTWNREGKHFLTIKIKFLALSNVPQSSKQLVITKGQCTFQGRSITWIWVKMPRNIQVNSFLKSL